MGRLVVERLAAVLDLSFVVLLVDDQEWWYSHPRSSIPSALRDALLAHARAELDQPLAAEARLERVQRLPVLVLPLVAEQRMMGVLCLGPKRSGDHYTAQDWALLGALGRQLTVVVVNHRLYAALEGQVATLRQVAAERLALSERVQEAGQRERRRLAAVLHDEAIQLGEELIRVVSAELACAGLGSPAQDRLAAAAFLGEELVGRLRAVVRELYPPSLETAGLVPALGALLREAGTDSMLTCRLQADPWLEHRRFAPEAELILYSLAREAMGNAVKHAQATTVEVTLCCLGEHLVLRVRDDGQGFTLAPMGTLLAAGHLGLALSRERAQELGGTLTITTAPGQGTVIEVRVPLPAAGPAREGVA